MPQCYKRHPRFVDAAIVHLIATIVCLLVAAGLNRNVRTRHVWIVDSKKLWRAYYWGFVLGVVVTGLLLRYDCTDC